MSAAANMVEVAALVGDTARATMLAALMGGQALTASELADLAHVTRATASGHLAKLAAARLVTATSKRRFRYYRLASPLVARMLESIKLVAALEVPARYQPRSARDDAERFARTCYDHIAGRLGVAIADALVDGGASMTPNAVSRRAPAAVTSPPSGASTIAPLATSASAIATPSRPARWS